MKPILSKAQLDYTKAKNMFENRAKVMEKEIAAKRAIAGDHSGSNGRACSSNWLP